MACELTVKDIIEATGGVAISTHQKRFVGVGTDTREALDNQIFVALRGESHDAHQYLEQAVSQGAKCLLIDKENEAAQKLKEKVTIVVVKDTLRGIQDLARFWRKQIKAKVVGITGSNGKTTTKEFAAAILSKQFKVHYSRGSFNNHWGVPISILGTSLFDEILLLEMGMNHSGELTQLSKIATPDIVVCTTVGRAHIGNFGGQIQGVADAKEEIYLANPKALKIFNHDNEYTLKMFERVSKLQGPENTLAYSTFAAGAEVGLRATHLELNNIVIEGHITGVKGDARVPVFGRQNVVNLMAAACIAVAVGMEPERIWAALPNCKQNWGRGQIVKLENGTMVLFDAYNSNPDSASMLIKNIFEITLPEGAKKVAIIGEMLELGTGSDALHQELGEMIGNTDIDTVWFIGSKGAAFKAGIEKGMIKKNLIISDNYEETLAKKVQSVLNPQDVVVMKGSRGIKLERVLQCWYPQFSTKK